LSAVAFTMPSKAYNKKIQPKNQTVSMNVTMYPLLQCQSSSVSVAKCTWPTFKTLVQILAGS